MILRRFAPFAADLWTRRELLWQFTLRTVELRHKGSHLGLIWSFLNPLLLLGLYVFVFGGVFHSSFGVRPGETPIDYALGLFLGLTIFQFISEVLAVSPIVIVSNPNFVKKVVFPLEILPAASVGAAAIHTLVSLGLVLFSLQVFGSGLNFGAFYLIIILLPIFLLCLGMSWLIAALGVFYRDIGQLMQFATLALMFSSGVFNSARKYPAGAWPYLRFNPVLHAIELARDATLWGLPLNYHHLLYLYVVGLAACLFGYRAFTRLKKTFADVL